MNKRQPFKTFSLTAIKTAISTLEQVSKPQNTSSISTLRNLIATTFSRKARIQQEEKIQNLKENVLKAIGTLKLYHPLIAQMQSGNSEEQHLAASFTAAIARFNTVLTNPIATSFNEWIIPFENKKTLEELSKHRVYFTLTQRPVNEKISLAFSSNISIGPIQSEIIFPQEIDTLRLKASTLIKQNNIHIGTSAETLAAIKTANIQMTSESNVKVALLTIPVIPGIDIQLKGLFQSHGDFLVSSVPLSDSFELTVYTSNKGFPHTSEYIGWSLSVFLLSETNPQKTPWITLETLHEKKSFLMEFLNIHKPNNKIPIIRNLLKQKTFVFTNNKMFFLELHKKLTLKLLNQVLNPAEISIIDQFFHQASLHINPYKYISDTYELVNNYFLALPYNRMQNLLFGQLVNQFQQDIENVIDKTLTQEMEINVQKLKEQRLNVVFDEDRASLDFTLLCGRYLWDSYKNIMLQNFSDYLGITLPPLNLFNKKIQRLAQRQLIFWLEELELESEKITADSIHARFLREFDLIFEILEENNDAED